MALTKEDLRFKLTFDADLEGVGKTLEAINKGLSGDKRGLGRAIANAVGAPAGVGAVIEVAQELQDKIEAKIKGLATAPIDLATRGLSTLARGLRELQGPLGPVGLGLEALKGGLELTAEFLEKIPLVGKWLAIFPEAAAKLVGPLKDVVGSLTDMARVSNPGLFELWRITLEDVQGVIGKRFVPVLEMMREGARLFGDALDTLLPSMDEMREILAPVGEALQELGASIRESLVEVGPFLKEVLVVGLKALSNVMAFTVRYGVTPLVQAFTGLYKIVREILGYLGIALPDRGGLGSSVGAAARPATFLGLEDYQRQFQLAAFSQGGSDPVERRHQEIKSPLDALVGKVDEVIGLLKTIVNPAGAVVQGAGVAANQAGFDVGQVIGNVLGRLRWGG